MKVFKTITSNDHTKKYYFQSSSNFYVEACLLNLNKYGFIICVSSQIGCSQKCKFCAAGNGKFVRNLTSNEIQEQIQLVLEDNPELLTNPFEVTYMGSGEPLNNFVNVFDSIDVIREKHANLTRVNISTTFPLSSKKNIDKTNWEKYKNFLHFQYSLHFPTDVERKKYLCTQLLSIQEAISQLNNIAVITNDIYKINYIPFNNLNDSEVYAKQLVEIMNTTKNSILKISEMCEINSNSILPSQAFNEFVSYISTKLKNVETFKSNGTDVNAGCGQFYNESLV